MVRGKSRAGEGLDLRQRRVLEHEAERALLLVALGEVTEVEHEAFDVGIVEHVRRYDFEEAPTTVGRADAYLGGVLDARSRERTGECLDRVRGFIGVDEIEGVTADELVGLVPEAAHRLRADERHRTGSVGDDDELRRTLDDRAKRAARLSDWRFASTRSVWSCTTQMTPSSIGSMRHS